MAICKPKRRKLKQVLSKRLPLRAAVTFYYARSTGGKREFRIKDAAPGFRSRLPSPHSYSYAHVYVDGILQSPLTYRLRAGRLRFRTSTLPPAGANIIAEFIAVYPPSPSQPAPRSAKKKASSSPKSCRRKKKLCCCKKRKRITKR
ncbi:DUF4183 domain-containing protein [Paenibacillus mesotrionivorans]|uniref:DUF4183 domain-containing protein n=1 Tax=Paenibacillus mesotrionivorans TaxID=3160968 RepID=A0ACC7P1I9_9BACL